MESDQLTLQQVQERVHAWISQFEEGYFHPLSNLARLTEEVGELARHLNHRFGDKPRKPTEDDGDLAEEIGDIIFVLVTLANQLDVDLDEALQQTLRKYDVRDADRFTRRSDDT